MKKLINLFLVVSVVVGYGCSEAKTVRFDAKTIEDYPSSPQGFQEKYGGEVKYLPADSSLKEKTANIDKAWIKTKEFEVFFWKSKDYYIQQMSFTTNTIGIGGVEVIGKTKDWIVQVFGKPKKMTDALVYYRDKEFELIFKIVDGIVVQCDLGRQI